MSHIPAIITCLKSYSKKTFFADLSAGLTVGVVALPLAMAFAIACGSEMITPATGLVTAIVAGFVMAFFSGSRFQIGGPTGAFVVIISGIVATHGFSGLVGCTLLAGIFMILFGVFKMGALIKFIPYPVITGFTAGLAVTIFSTQIKDIFGLEIPHVVPAEFIEKWGCYFNYMDTINPWALGLTALTIICILLSKRLFPRVPSMLVGMLISTAIAIIFKLPVETIGSRFGELPTGLPSPSLPNLNWDSISSLIQPAFIIALLASIESLLSASVADGMTGTRHKPNAELIAQGAGNIASALFGGLPASGAIARTATNVKAGGKTPISGIIHAITLLLILLIAGQYAAMVPLAALAGILAIVCWNMLEVGTFCHLLRGPKPDCAVLLITFLLTVVINIVVAVEVGVVLAALLFMGRMAQISQIENLGKNLISDDEEEDPTRSRYLRQIADNIEVFDVQGPFFFGVVEQFKDIAFSSMRHEIDYVVLRMRLVPALDASGLNVLDNFLSECKKHDIKLILCGLQKQPKKSILADKPFIKELSKENICADLDHALARIEIFEAAKQAAKNNKVADLQN